MNFADAAIKETQVKFTENGALAFNTTNSALLDFFSLGGALRNREESDIKMKFKAAFNENEKYAVRTLFYIRDIRNGGLGERRTFRICLQWLSDNHPEIIKNNLYNIGFFGRFDDLFCLFDTEKKNNVVDVVNVIGQLLSFDIIHMNNNEPISLLAKWLPSINTSSEKTRRYARIICQYLKVKEKTYRKTLAALRKYLKVTERLMSDNDWEKIDYESVPSYAMKNYRTAFKIKDSDRFYNYLASLSKGEKKINASTLYPYDLVHNYLYYRCLGASVNQENEVIEAQWKALPNYVEGKNNFIVMADVSGSMEGRPLETSVGLATYFAKRNNGAYKDLYMTFSSNPHFVNLSNCDSLHDCIKKAINTDIGFDTNLEAAFEYILRTAINNNVSKEEMPKALVVISDMEINHFNPNSPYYHKNQFDFIELMKEKFKAFNYEMPKIILWNVEARHDTFLTQDNDVLYVSGQSASVFKRLCGSLEGKTAYEFMIETLDNPIYDKVIC